MSNLISISGRMGSGKDLAAKIIRRLDMIRLIEEGKIPYQSLPSLENLLSDNIFIGSHWKVRKFATPLKQIASILLNVPFVKFEDQEFKKTFLPEEWNIDGNPITVRTFLQKLGTDAIRNGLHPDTWVNALFNKIEPEEKTVITDTRFPNELDRANLHAGIIIRLFRGNIPKNEHSSETALDGSNFMYDIHNNGSIQDLENKIKDILLWEDIF